MPAKFAKELPIAHTSESLNHQYTEILTNIVERTQYMIADWCQFGSD
jgi:uncharacterized protein YdiU (UPF0061 family)